MDEMVRDRISTNPVVDSPRTFVGQKVKSDFGSLRLVMLHFANLDLDCTCASKRIVFGGSIRCSLEELYLCVWQMAFRFLRHSNTDGGRSCMLR